MKHQALFSLKDKSKKGSSATILRGSLRIKTYNMTCKGFQIWLSRLYSEAMSLVAK